jgi:hypothetical protein
MDARWADLANVSWPGQPGECRSSSTIPVAKAGGAESETERGEVSILLDQNDRLGFPGLWATAHARGVCRHAGQGQSNRVGMVLEQSKDRSGRDVTFDHVPFDERRVTRFGTGWYSVLLFEFGQLWIFSEIDCGSK